MSVKKLCILKYVKRKAKADFLFICFLIWYLRLDVKRRYKQNLLETFYGVTNSFTLSLDSDPQTIRSITINL